MKTAVITIMFLIFQIPTGAVALSGLETGVPGVIVGFGSILMAIMGAVVTLMVAGDN